MKAHESVGTARLQRHPLDTICMLRHSDDKAFKRQWEKTVSIDRVLLCRCSNTELVPRERVRAVECGLKKQGRVVQGTDDLCGALERQDPDILDFIDVRGPLTVIACYPRAVRALLKWAGVSLDDRDVSVLNVRAEPLDPALEKIGAVPGAKAPARPSEGGGGGWAPWYPVIDEGRCTNCGQCLDFCLFGVYERTQDGRVHVANPRACKNHCPACARICPRAAIIFPKLDSAPINGDTMGDEHSAKARIRLNIDELLGEDAYAALAARKAKRKPRLVTEEARRRALGERAACSTKRPVPGECL